MPRFKIAHVREQGVDLIIVPLDRSFEQKSAEDQEEAIIDLQQHAGAASLRGTIVPVWDSGGGRMKFIAPTHWHSYFRSLSLRQVMANVNRELFW